MELLTTPVVEIFNGWSASSDHQGPHPDGSADFVGGDAYRVDAPLADRELDVAKGLNGVQVNGNAMRFGNPSNLSDWLNTAHLVIGHQTGDPGDFFGGEFTKGQLEIVEVHPGLAINIDPPDASESLSL